MVVAVVVVAAVVVVVVVVACVSGFGGAGGSECGQHLGVADLDLVPAGRPPWSSVSRMSIAATEPE